MISDIKDFSWNQTLSTIFGFLGVVAPGFLVIYLYKPDMVASLETVKLLIFSISLSAPVFATNMIFLMNTPPARKRDYASAIVGLFLASVILYAGLLIAYLFAFTFKVFLLVVAVLQFLILISLWIHDRRLKKHA